ncbi:glycosyltransferase [Pedobacter sp. P26]|uniref:glycosyltransferase n=1 Tax=Pedobacter sp. P26 TaxID=3423956 RepID=UPI003D66D617
MSLAISIVLFENGDELDGAIESVLAINANLQLYLIDNSPTDLLKRYANDKRITYVYNGKNHGYGRAHNIALHHALNQKIKYHLVMNPDICFSGGTVEAIIKYMDANLEVGALIPRVYYESGRLQRLCKLLPTPFDLIGRRFLSNTQWAARQNAKYELNKFDYDKILNIPCLSGCFMFLRTAALEKTGLFDERFFMYLEDYDLARRINRFYRTVFFLMSALCMVLRRVLIRTPNY